MPIFGDKNSFAIECVINECMKDYIWGSTVGHSWGMLVLWVDGVCLGDADDACELLDSAFEGFRESLTFGGQRSDPAVKGLSPAAAVDYLHYAVFGPANIDETDSWSTEDW